MKAVLRVGPWLLIQDVEPAELAPLLCRLNGSAVFSMKAQRKHKPGAIYE